MKDGKIIRSAGVVGSFTLLSRGLGMLRDIIFSYHFGTSLLASAFLLAFRIPNLFRRLFGEGALSAAFIPIFIETRSKQGDKAAWNLAAKVVTMTAALLTAVAILGVILFSVGTLVPGLSEKWLTTFELGRIMFPYVLLICMAALSMAVLNSFKHFATSAFAPCLLNIILIGVMVVVFPLAGEEPTNRAMALAWGVVIAGVAQVAIQLPALKRFGCPFKFSSHWNDPKVRQMLLLMGPAALGMAVTQFNVLIDGVLAMWIGDWAGAALSYGERWIYLPLGVIATAMSTVLLPTFSSHAAEGDHVSMSETITAAMRHMAFIMTPAAFGIFALAPLLVQTTMEWGGKFDARSTELTVRALIFYAPGLILFSAAKVFVPAFYALQDTKTPVRVGFLSIFINLVMNIAFILTLPEYWKHAGMALSTVLAAGVNVAILGALLHRKIPNIEWKEIYKGLIRALVRSTIMAAAAWSTAYFALPFLANILPSKFAQIGTLGLAVATGAIVYFTLGLKAPEFRDIKSAIRGK